MRACGSPTCACILIAPLPRPRKSPAIVPSPPSNFFPDHRTVCSFLFRGDEDLIHLFERQRWRRLSQSRRGEYGKGEEEERSVHCEVDVVSWRERRIRARVLVHADMETVWGVLTDYERLADFIPNLLYSGRIPCPHPGRIWLEQRGLQRALYWHIEARVVLDLQELTNVDNGRELQFTMVDGDFKKFEGKWSVEAGSRPTTTVLTYEVSVMPRFNFPAIFLERIIRSDLPVNLRALASRAESTEDSQISPLLINGISSSHSSSFPSRTLEFSGNLCEIDIQNLESLKETYAAHVFGRIPPNDVELNNKWGIFGTICRLDNSCMADEVHLRRFDGLLENGGSHCCVVASITVKAPVHNVWNVLTAYETLPEIVPNLAISKVLLRDNSKVRILQEGCKGLLYMVLHARVILDLYEKHEEEISFEQVEGDFDSFQGKWQLEQLGDQHTLLKYSVKSKMYKDTFLSEAIVEEVVYEDLPSNLCAIRDFVENKVAILNDSSIKAMPPDEDEDEDEDACIAQNMLKEEFSSMISSNSSRHRPKVPGLQKDIEVLKAEIAKFILKHGQEGFMPMRKQLRSHGRLDIEKAVTGMGGFRKIANLMDLCLAYKHRKPKGYWDNLENLKEEISRFQKHWGMDPTYMPSRKAFERAGRYDIARALEKWGGLQEVSRLLSLNTRHPRRKPDPQGDAQQGSQVLDEPQDPGKASDKPLVSQDAQKWLNNLKDLNINWVE